MSKPRQSKKQIAAKAAIAARTQEILAKRREQQTTDPRMTLEWKSRVAAAICRITFVGEGGGYGTCRYYAALGKMAFDYLGVECRQVGGSMLYRAGRGPRDIVAFRGRTDNVAAVPTGYHMWLEVGGDIIDFSPAAWGELARARGLMEPPTCIWQPRATLTAPWRPDGAPDFGDAWYHEGARDEFAPHHASVPDEKLHARLNGLSGEARVQAYFDCVLDDLGDVLDPVWPVVKAALPSPLRDGAETSPAADPATAPQHSKAAA